MNTSNLLLGRKVELISTSDQYTKIKPGYTGIINFIDDTGTLHVNWEDGSTLGLIPGIDLWRLVS